MISLSNAALVDRAVDAFWEQRIPSEPESRVFAEIGCGIEAYHQFCSRYPQNEVDEWAWKACTAGPADVDYHEACGFVHSQWQDKSDELRYFLDEVDDVLCVCCEAVQ